MKLTPKKGILYASTVFQYEKDIPQDELDAIVKFHKESEMVEDAYAFLINDLWTVCTLLSDKGVLFSLDTYTALQSFNSLYFIPETITYKGEVVEYSENFIFPFRGHPYCVEGVSFHRTFQEVIQFIDIKVG